MKIVTVNVPESFLTTIEMLIGDEGLYPSRSELIRCAVREFLLKEIKLAKKMALHNESIPDNLAEFDLDESKFVRIPLEKKDENNEPKTEFKTFKVLEKLDSNPNSKPKAKEVKKKGPMDKGKWKKKPLGNPFHPRFEGSKYI